MSKLYDIITKVIDTNSLVEAEKILYGKDGIVINSSEYYKNIISNFIQKKEIIIKKDMVDNRKTQLIFDLNNCNELWNIIFIYNYYIRYIDKKIELLNKNIKQYVIIQGKLKGELNKLNLTDPLYQEKRRELNELTSYLNELRQLKQNYEKYKTKSLQENLIKLENMPDIDENELKEYIQKLKEAITCVQKMRDSLAHANRNLSIDSIVKIDNPKNKFEISIPIEYLDGFNKGRIIANEEDWVLIQQTNDISLPLLKALDYDIKKIDSFFYNVDPNYLDFLLEQINYDHKKLYKLSSDIFTYPYETKIFLSIGMNIFDITKLPHYAFEYQDNAMWLKELYTDITKLPEISFKYSKESVMLLKKNIDIAKLPESAFLYYKATVMLLENGIDITKLPENAFRAFYNNKKTIKLIEKNIDIYRLSESAFDYPEETIIFLNNKIDITKLPESAFNNPDKTLILLKNGIDIYNLVWSAFENSEATIKLYQNNINIYELPWSAFKNPEGTIKMFEYGINIYELPYPAFNHSEETIQMYQANIDVSKLQQSAFSYPQETIKLYQENIDIYNIPMAAFYNCDKAIRLFKANIDITKLPSEAFGYTRLTMKLHEENIDIYKIPEIAYKYPEKIKLLKQSNIDISKLPPEAFQYIDLTIKLYQENINIYKLPSKCFTKNLKILNLNIILEKVDYNQLDTLPIEFFECDTELLDTMFQRYNSNISKSIFGIKNPKIIAILLYANNVLSEYNHNISIDEADIQIESIIANTCNDSFKYQKNIEANIGKKITSQEFIDQFQLTDENNELRSDDSIVRTFLNKIRNASEHFRFKTVKDQDGSELEDKIYLYDEDNMGINNFNLIIDLNYLLNIIRNVEKLIITKNTGNKKR